MTLQELQTKIANKEITTETVIASIKHHRKALSVALGSVIIVCGGLYIGGYQKAYYTVECEGMFPWSVLILQTASQKMVNESEHNFIYKKGLMDGLNNRLNSCY